MPPFLHGGRLLHGARRWTLDAQRLVFLHIPKTAGMAVTTSLCQALDLRKRKSPVPFVPPRHEWVMLHDHLSAEDRAVALRRSSGARLVFGHFAIDTYEAIARPGDFVFTFLRDPVERVRSVYRFWLQTGERLPYDIDLRDMSFSEFLKFPRPEHRRHVDNTMTRLLGGAFLDAELGKEEWRRVLDRARRVVDAMPFVGLTESYSSDIVKLYLALGLPPPRDSGRVNITSEDSRRRADAHDDLAVRPGARDLIERCTRHDRVLYDHARRFAAREA